MLYGGYFQYENFSLQRMYIWPCLGYAISVSNTSLLKAWISKNTCGIGSLSCISCFQRAQSKWFFIIYVLKTLHTLSNFLLLIPLIYLYLVLVTADDRCGTELRTPDASSRGIASLDLLGLSKADVIFFLAGNALSNQNTLQIAKNVTSFSNFCHQKLSLRNPQPCTKQRGKLEERKPTRKESWISHQITFTKMKNLYKNRCNKLFWFDYCFYFSMARYLQFSFLLIVWPWALLNVFYSNPALKTEILISTWAFL